MRPTLTRFALPTSVLLALVAVPICAAEFTAPQDSSSAELSTGADGRIYLSWIAESGRTFSLQYVTFANGTWSAPRTVAEGTDWLVNWAERPAVTASADGTLLAHWLRRTGATAYEIRMSLSLDDGATWQPAVTLHDDATPTEHGAVSVLPGASQFDVVWLDGRWLATGGTATAHHAAMHHATDSNVIETPAASGADTPGTSLRHATVSADTTAFVQSSVEIDARVCDCCNTAIARTANGLLLAYRDRSADESRNVVVRQYVAGRWSAALPMADPPWRIEGCPMNGPALTTDGDRAAVVWFTAAADEPRVFTALSQDGGNSFGAPVRIDEGGAIGRVSVVALDDGGVLAAWVERDRRSSALKIRHVHRDGTVGPAHTLREQQAVITEFPSVVRAGDDLIVAWTDESTRRTRVTAASVPVDRFL